MGGKLVRDRMPEIIGKKGETAEFRIAPHDEIVRLLNHKLVEESQKLGAAPSLEDLVDVYEVILAILARRGWTEEELRQVRAAKFAQHGGFEAGIVIRGEPAEPRENLVVEEPVVVACRGVGFSGDPVLETPVEARVTFVRRDPPLLRQTVISTTVNCPFNTGGHGDRCKAAHPEKDKVGDGIGCPFSFDYPYAREQRPGWKPPATIADVFEKVANVRPFEVEAPGRQTS